MLSLPDWGAFFHDYGLVRAYLSRAQARAMQGGVQQGMIENDRQACFGDYLLEAN